MGRPPRSLAPNIVLVLTDQQRADTIAALGNDMIKTPVLDRLVASGTTFTNAYTPSPVCVPARHALITGLPPHRTGVVDNVERAPEARSFMEMLAARGYQTHGVGKMHFCGDPRRAWGFESRDYSEELDESDDYRGFLRAAGYGHVIDPLGIRSEFYYLPQPSQLPAHLHHTAWVADRSIEFLRRRDRTRPFFLWSSFIKPHPPFESPNPWGRLYRSSEMSDPLRPNDGADHQTFWNRMQNRYKYMDGGSNPHLCRTQRASYYSAISFIDFHLGRIVTQLGDELDDTLVVFTSDHGEMLGDFGCFGKRCMLDASVRVPLIVRLPGRFASGARCAKPVSLLDLFPTFAAVAGAEEQMPWPEAGSLEPIARGQVPREHVTSQFSQRSLGLYLLAEESWKYIYSAADRKEWLFNCAADPQELENLVGQPSSSGQLQRLRAKLTGIFERDGYDWAVDEGKWRDYGITRLPGDDRGGLLYQDPSMLQGEVGQLDDYARTPAAAIDWLGATMPAAMDKVSGRISFPDA